MGELKGGMLFDISMAMARRLLMPKQKEDGGIALLEEIGEKVAFEIAVGRNGKVWVKSGGVKETLLVGRALQETDVQGLSLEEQVKAVRKLMRQVWLCYHNGHYTITRLTREYSNPRSKDPCLTLLP